MPDFPPLRLPLRWKFVELWDDLHYKGRLRTLRRHMCAFGLHHPITFWGCGGGYSSPVEDGWACELCGHERLPYRAFLWRVPLIGRWVR
jgi:hypothetical protein